MTPEEIVKSRHPKANCFADPRNRQEVFFIALDGDRRVAYATAATERKAWSRAAEMMRRAKS